MASNVEMVVKRFIKAVKDGDDLRKLHSIVNMIPKPDLMSWTDNNQQDVLHYAVMAGNAEAVDFLLKMGYFAAPYEPQVNMYAHLAARLGFRAVLCTILKHRPEDFKESQQPQVVSPELDIPRMVMASRRSSREPELIMPAVIGSQVFLDGKASKETSSAFFSSKPPTPHKKFSSPFKLPSSTRAGRLSLAEGAISLSPRERNSENYELSFHCKELIGMTSTKRALMEKRRFSSPEDSGGSFTSKPLKYTPLDVAARSKHVDCVKALLDMYVLRAHPDVGSKGYHTLAALANNLPSLKLLLEPYSNGTNDHSVREDYRMAVQVCVQNMYAECLELLLNAEIVDTKLIFKQINYFHVMYSQPFNTYLKVVSLSRLPVVTENLIARGHDVNVKMPPRTYPLYSLIDNAFSCKDFTFSEYFVTCMNILMENGADPNFDEVEHERQLAPSVGSRLYGGRYAYSSALHCVIQSVEHNHGTCPSKSPAIRFAEDCVDALIVYGADIEKMGCIDGEMTQIRGDVLWQFARSSVGMGMERALLHCLTRFGAQPQRKIDGQFALNVYLDTLCDLMKGDVVNAKEILGKREKDLGQMVCLMCSFMAPWHIKTVWDIFNYKHKKCSGEAHEAFKQKVGEALETQSKLIHTLRTITAWQVWKLCQRKAANVKRLPVPKELKMRVLPLVLFHTLW